MLDVPGLTIVTNSVRVASLFGTVRPAGQLGAAAQVVDQLFLGCHGIDLAAGLTTPNLAEAETNRAFVQAARRVTVVADHTKWGIVGLSSFAALDEVDTLITDSELHPEARGLITEQVEELILADGSPDGQAMSAARPASDGG